MENEMMESKFDSGTLKTILFGLAAALVIYMGARLLLAGQRKTYFYSGIVNNRPVDGWVTTPKRGPELYTSIREILSKANPDIPEGAINVLGVARID